jgi:hypothetical protein
MESREVKFANNPHLKPRLKMWETVAALLTQIHGVPLIKQKREISHALL